MHRRGYTPKKLFREEKLACLNCGKLILQIEIKNQALQRQLDKLTMEREREKKGQKEEMSRMEEKLYNLIELNNKQEREIKDLEIKLQEKEEEIQQLKNMKIAPQPKMEPKEEARQQSLQQKLMEAAEVEVWSDLEKKQQLYVGKSGLGELPTKLCLLTQLKSLSLGGNHLKFLPENIGALKELQTLYLDQNQLTKLPQSLFDLRELTLLILSYNQLTELPESLGNLRKLQKLGICYNRNLKELPKSFKNLKDLNVLLIGWQLLPKQNIFQTEPFIQFKNLQILYIYNLGSDANQREEAIKKECKKNKIQVQFW